MYWKIGHRINIDFFDNQRAGWETNYVAVGDTIATTFWKAGFSRTEYSQNDAVCRIIS